MCDSPDSDQPTRRMPFPLRKPEAPTAPQLTITVDSTYLRDDLTHRDMSLDSPSW